MKIVQFVTETGSPNSAEWHAWRAGGIGGSDAGAIAADVGMIPNPPKWFKTADQLWRLKTRQEEDTFRGNWATERGHRGEAPIREAYEAQTGILLAPMFGEMDSWNITRSSFDGVAADFSVYGEIKCPGEAVHAMAKNGEVVPYYKAQLVHQALTLWDDPDTWAPDGEAHFITGIPEIRGCDIAIVRIQARRMRDYARRLLDAEREFWQKVVEHTAPAGDGWAALAAAWKAAEAALKAAKLEKENAEGLIRAYIDARGVKVLDGDGVKAAIEARRGSIDYAAIVKARLPELTDAELEEYRKPGSEPFTVRAIK